MNIKFGTDGWRGKVGEIFTDENLSIVTQATCDFLKEKDQLNNFVVVGYDNRFRSEQFADIVAEILSSNGFEVLLSNSSVSTPVVSFVTHRFKAALGLCITASHNPPEYNGFKIKENFGGSALTKTIEDIVPLLGKTKPLTGNRTKITKIDLTAEYFTHLRQMFDLNKISSHFQSSPIHLNYMHGSPSGYVGEVLRNIYVPTMEYNLDRNLLFGGTNPEPIPSNMKDFMSGIRTGLGFAFDGDGDRIAAVTSSGEYVNSSQLMALVIPHLRKKSSASKCAFTVSCSDIAHKSAEVNGLNVLTTKIGFKHIADHMLKNGPILIGGEESGGIGFTGYIPERDGIANCLLVLEALASYNVSLEVKLAQLEDQLGVFEQRRRDIIIQSPEKVLEGLKRIKESPDLFSANVSSVEDIDGVKLRLSDGSWIMFRQSGTEPVLRIYAESEESRKTENLIIKGANLLCQ